MQIQAINNTNFGKIYRVTRPYTDSQENVIEQIKGELRKPSKKFGNKTAEEFYESNNKMDFLLDKSTFFDSIRVSGVYGAKQVGVGADERYKFSDSFVIGTYDEAHPFKTNDIESGRKQYRINGLKLCLNMGLIGIAAAAYFFAIALAAKHDAVNKMQESTKPLIENVDSLAIKAKAALPDTVRTLNLIK